MVNKYYCTHSHPVNMQSLSFSLFCSWSPGVWYLQPASPQTTPCSLCSYPALQRLLFIYMGTCAIMLFTKELCHQRVSSELCCYRHILTVTTGHGITQSHSGTRDFRGTASPLCVATYILLSLRKWSSQPSQEGFSDR